MALSSQTTSDAVTSAKAWLEKIQDSNGCWNSGNIRDTAFILWAAYAKSVIPCTGDECIEPKPDCEVAGNGYCMVYSDCVDAGGDPTAMSSFDCSSRSGIQVCCDKQKKQQSCSDMQGIICTSGEQCIDNTVSASNTNDCCLAECVSETSECESAGYTCKPSCLSTEQEENYNCDSGNLCCKPKTTPVVPGKSYWWIWLLVILIVLVVIAILFRDRLRMIFFKFKHKGSSQSVSKTRPPFFPPSNRPMMRPMQQQPRYYPPATSKPVTKTDKEADETFRKLKEMSK